MPFKSEKQRRYLFKNEPAIAKKWTKKYGSKPIKKKGKNQSSEQICPFVICHTNLLWFLWTVYSYYLRNNYG